MLVKYVLDGGPNKQGAIEMEQEIDIPAGALQQLCLWQLVLGYRLREKEAEVREGGGGSERHDTIFY